MGNGKFHPCRIGTPQPITEELSHVIKAATITTVQIWSKSVHWGGAFGQMDEYNEF